MKKKKINEVTEIQIKETHQDLGDSGLGWDSNDLGAMGFYYPIPKWLVGQAVANHTVIPIYPHFQTSLTVEEIYNLDREARRDFFRYIKKKLDQK